MRSLSVKPLASGLIWKVKSPPESSPALLSEVTSSTLCIESIFPSASLFAASALLLLMNNIDPALVPLVFCAAPSSKYAPDYVDLKVQQFKAKEDHTMVIRKK